MYLFKNIRMSLPTVEINYLKKLKPKYTRIFFAQPQCSFILYKKYDLNEARVRIFRTFLSPINSVCVSRTFMCATKPGIANLFHLMFLIIISEQCKLSSSLFCSFLHYSLTSSSFIPDSFLMVITFTSIFSFLNWIVSNTISLHLPSSLQNQNRLMVVHVSSRTNFVRCFPQI
jgi:hypothetical protein